MYRPLFISAAVTICLASLALPSLAQQDDTPTTQPAAAPTTEPVAVELPADSPVRGWFNDLASPDAMVRDKAQTQLMGMTREQLEGLRLLIAKEETPLKPNQVAALHDIVIHVFLANESYEPAGRQPFLGVRWPQEPAFMPYAESPRIGVPLEERIPGFPGFQMLRDGDLILSVTIRSPGPLDQWTPHPTPGIQPLVELLRSASLDSPVIMEVLRQGQRMKISVRLAPKPAALVVAQTADAMAESFFAPRLQRAENYWQERFLPLLPQNVS
jgi:hypothetical protein